MASQVPKDTVKEPASDAACGTTISPNQPTGCAFIIGDNIKGNTFNFNYDVLPALHYLMCRCCSKLLPTPKTLDCHHSFCTKCLQDYYDTFHAGLPTFPCPYCQQTIRLPANGMQGLQTNTYLARVIEGIEKMALPAGKTNNHCEVCTEGKTALHRCLECVRKICPSCQRSHKRIPSCVGHTILPLEDIREGKVMVTKESTDYRCKKHEGEALRFYCETCQELICRDCTVAAHCKPDHNFVDSIDAALKCKQSLIDTFAVLGAKIDENKDTLAEMAKAKQEFKNNIDRTVKEAEDAADAIIAKVQADKKRLIDEIKALEQERTREFHKHEKAVKEMLQRTQDLLKKAQDVSNNASESDLLSHYPILSKDMNSLINSLRRPKIKSRIPHLKITKKYRPVGDFVLGELEQVDGKWELNVEFGKKNNRFGASTVHFLPAEEIAVLNYKKNQVSIHSTTGTQKAVIQTNPGPSAVAALNNQLIVTDETDCVKVYNRNNTLAFEFKTVQEEDRNTPAALESLAVKKNTILVGDTKRMVLTEHRHDGSLIRTIPVNLRPSFLTVDSNDRVVISECVSNDVVGVVDDNGTTLFTIKPVIKDSPFVTCSGVCCDGTDIFIAVIGKDKNCHIHQYNGDGKFLSCIIQGLYLPYGISFSVDEKIAVADEESVKIYNKV